MNRHSAALFVLLAASMSGTANAAPILPNAVAIQPVGVAASTTLSSSYAAGNMIDQVSLSASYISGVTPASAIDDINPLNDGKGWHGGFNVQKGSITFDLGSSYTLDRVFLFWMNQNESEINNIANFNIDVSADAGFSSFVTAATFGIPSAPKNRVDFSGLATGEFVRLQWTAVTGSYPGLKEFIAGGIAASVPEPASVALLGIGLAGIGAMRRKYCA